MKYINHFFNNGSYEDNPNNQVPLDTIHEQKKAKYLETYDGHELDITDSCAICALNDYSTMTYPQIAPFYGEKKGVIIEGKGVVLIQPKNEIWYTSSDGNIITPNSVAFGDGITIVSNTYENGKGVIKLSGNVTTIGNETFGEKQNLESISIPSGVTSIGDYAFAVCASLLNIHIPDSVTSIGDWAFVVCTSLTNIDIPDTVTSIGNSAFQDCESLTSIEIPDSVTSIGEGAFENINVVIYNGTAEGSPWGALYLNPYIENDFAYTDNTKTILVGYLGNNKIITIPDSVTSIGEGAFYSCRSLTSVVIPDSVISIGNSAFSSCSGLTSIEIPDGVTTIGEYAFYGCTSLTSIEIPDSLTSIGNSVFSGCSSLTSVVIPDSVTSIGSEAFYQCSGLTSVTIGNGVTTINREAFYQCSGLTSVTIPGSVTIIYLGAFGSCTGLNSITFVPLTPPELDSGVFENTNNCPIYVPETSVNVYKDTYKQTWCNYADRIEAIQS